MKITSFLACFFLLFFLPLHSQTYDGSGGSIADDGTTTDFILDVQGLDPDMMDAQHGLVRVCINITHTWIADLDIRLISPSGVNIMLTSGLGWDTDAYLNTCFDMDAGQHISDGGPPFEGTYKPFTNLGNANNQTSGNGLWTLRFLDTYAYADGGELLSWNLTFGPEPHTPFIHPGTKLPIIEINTENYTIPNEPKIPGLVRVVFDSSGNLNQFGGPVIFESRVGIEVRGASSQGFPKKSYALETQDEFGEDLEAKLLGLDKEEDWILYAPYTDKTFLRDALTYQLGRDLGGYAPRTVACELFVNGDYQGVYWLEEKIKRDKNRVDINKLNPADTLGDPLTGGYIIKVDRDDGEGTFFVSNYEGSYPNEEIRIVYEDPEGPDMHPKQKEYISGLMHNFENALYGDQFMDPQLGYRRYIDVPDLVDYFIISELGHNVDAYRLSTFIYKNRNSEDSLLHLGPLWDFNLAYGNVDYCQCQYVEGWAYVNSTNCGNTPLWWGRFLEDPFFRNEVRCRFDELRQDQLSNGTLDAKIDSMALPFMDPAETNYERWPILGRYVWPNFYIGNSYQDELNYLKYWIIQRLEWMEDNLPGKCTTSEVPVADESRFILSPNPADRSVTINAIGKPLHGKISVIDAKGMEFPLAQMQDEAVDLDVSSLAPGLYLVIYAEEKGKRYFGKLVISRG